jgi:lysozyme
MESLFRAPSRRVYLLAVLAILGGCAVQTRDEPVGHSSQAITVCAAGSTVKGVDVSVFQGTVGWPAVKSGGIDFAIARISDGTYLDTEFSTNWSGMKSAGLVRGAYQYFEPGEDPTTQASIVVTAVGKLGAGDLPVTADMETTGGQSAATIVANLKTWASAVQAGTGKVPMIYTAVGYWDSSVASSAFASDPLWVANWGVTCPDLSTGWTNWSVWQYSDSGSVGGISGAVDLDEYNGTLAQLQAFAGGGTTTSDGGTTGYYGATYVSQSWPLAATTMMMTTCQTLPATITFKNTGTKSWDSNTRLATTEPRDRKSDFGDSTWVSDNRLAQVTGTVAPGGTFEFKFDFHAPPTTGSYDEHFGLVEDGVAWFSDPGQGGPPDTDIEAKIDVTAGTSTCTVDPAVPDGGMTSHDAGMMTDSGSTPHDSSTPVDSSKPARDGGEPSVDATPPSDSGSGFVPRGENGCSCVAAGHRTGPGGAGWAFGILAAAATAARATRRKRR